MKKILFGILTFLGIGLSFCSAGSITISCNGEYDSNCLPYPAITFTDSVSNVCFTIDSVIGLNESSYILGYSYSITNGHDAFAFSNNNEFCFDSSFSSLYFYDPGYGVSFDITLSSPLISDSGGGEDTGSISTIDVYYNNGNSVENITCDGVQAIEIQGLSTITSTNTFTPYYNISYTDEDNQKLTESYSKDILYLENGQFKKTYTGNNDWILTVQGNNSENQFSGYLPTFEITGGIEEVSESGNIFNNFAENSVKFTLSNIPSYIQYVILLFILFFILGFIRKFRRK